MNKDLVGLSMFLIVIAVIGLRLVWLSLRDSNWCKTFKKRRAQKEFQRGWDYASAMYKKLYMEASTIYLEGHIQAAKDADSYMHFEKGVRAYIDYVEKRK